ncbi:MAG TPA: hypothetical protein VKB80_13040 [Kofleriaceae bacterium]|nr:hypothetical protein [Kofleriaceae bacterium]
MTVVCFGCGGRFDRALVEEVGDALFCRLCVGRLLRRVEERDGADRAAPRAQAGAAGAVSAPAADAPCFLCGEPLEGEAFVRLRGFAICAGCSRAFAGDPAGEGGESADGESAATAGGETPAPAAFTPDRERDHHGNGESSHAGAPAAPIEWCAGCGRALPGPGSYRLLEGRPHCPDCVAARPVVRRPGAAAGGVEACDACRREVSAGALRTTSGFHLCLPCIDSDRELALAVARARHRRRLERQGRRLLGDEDDD